LAGWVAAAAGWAGGLALTLTLGPAAPPPPRRSRTQLGGDPGSIERESALLSMLVQMDGINGKLEQVCVWGGGGWGCKSRASCGGSRQLLPCASALLPLASSKHHCTTSLLAALAPQHLHTSRCPPPPRPLQVLTIGATNLAQDLDQALLRPGRFEVWDQGGPSRCAGAGRSSLQPAMQGQQRGGAWRRPVCACSQPPSKHHRP
jgi:hypothetical protein